MKFWWALLFLFCSSCHIRPYSEPETPTPNEWKGPSAEVNTPQFENWWLVFSDPELNALEECALCYNRNIEKALWNAVSSYYQARTQLSPLFPSVDLLPNFASQSELLQFQNPVFPAVPFRVNAHQWQFPLSISYEMDFFWKYRSGYLSSFANAEAQYEAYRTSLLTVTAAVANNYFIARSLDAEIALYEEAIVMRETSVLILKTRYEAGLSNYEDVARAETELANTRADLDEYIRQRAVVENNLAVLIGEEPSYFTLPHDPLLTLPPEIPAGIPSSILCKRPDIRELERTMASVYYQVGVAYASLFPSFGINTLLGYGSPFFQDLFTWQARLFEVTAGMAQNLFDAGLRRSTLNAAKAKLCMAHASYQDGVLNAFQEVENSLIQLKMQREQAKNLDQGVLSAQIVYDLASERYMKGLDNYLNVVDAERTLLDTQRRSVRILGTRYVSTVQLIKALGGGWDTL